MEDEYYRQLVKRYIDKKISDDELEVFAHLLTEGKLDDYLAETMNADHWLEETPEAETADYTFNQPISAKYKSLWFRYVAAAAVLFLSATFYFYLKPQKQPVTKNTLVKNDFLPGANKAILTLANGSKLNLTAHNNGLLAHQGATAIDKNEEGKVEYHTGNTQQLSVVTVTTLYNTITTPKGGQYQVMLPDGTKVWLNTASSIRFPTVFAGNERNVEISGEVYFEVVKNKEHPFTVTSGNQKVTVLGTHFNINAYADEAAVKTTLLEGRVKVSTGADVVFLKPGQQSQLAAGDKLKVTDDIDTDEAVAWKNGFFQFNKADVKTIMHQIARWYNVDVEFEGQSQPGHYRGRISRNVNASKVLRVLELSGMHFIIEGRKIIVK